MLDQDLFVNFLFDQPQQQFKTFYNTIRNNSGLPRPTSNQQLSALLGQNYQG